MTTYETTPLSAAGPAEVVNGIKLRSHEVWAAPIFAVAATGLFALVVNLVRLGFAHDWLDPAGYIVALLKPLVLTFPGYLVFRVVLGRCDLSQEIARAASALRRASLSVVCYAPVIWFYLITSPTPTATFPIIAFSFGAVVFWVPLLIALARKAGPGSARWLSYVWIGLMFLAEAQTMLGWLAEGVQGRST